MNDRALQPATPEPSNLKDNSTPRLEFEKTLMTNTTSFVDRAFDPECGSITEVKFGTAAQGLEGDLRNIEVESLVLKLLLRGACPASIGDWAGRRWM